MAKSILLFFALIAVAQSIYFYPQLPEITASHFDSAGNPDGWMSKYFLVLFYLGMVAILLAIFLFIPRFPNRMKNIPNRDYWLSGDREAETNEYINSSTLRIGIATIVLLVYVMQLVFEANIYKVPILSGSIFWALVLYFAFIAIWLIKFYARFRTIPKNTK